VSVACTAAVGWKGISRSVLDEAGVAHDPSSEIVTVPYRRPDGSLLRVRYREGDRAWWGPGEEICLFGLDTLPPPATRSREHSAVLLLEGESDVLCFREHLGLYDDGRACAYYALGLPGVTTWRSEWVEHIDGFGLRYLALDGDEAGRRATRGILPDLHGAAVLPIPEGSDVRSVLQTDGPEALLALLDEADWIARLSAALHVADDLDHFEALLQGRAHASP
jgi:hypothetical protein